MRKRRLLKRIILPAILCIGAIFILGGCSCGAPASAEIETSTLEETEETTEDETTAEETAGNHEVQNLVEIFSPSKYLDKQTYDVIRTQEQYDTLKEYDITEETHWVDDIILIIVCEINSRGEENVTDEEVIELIGQWAEDGRKVESRTPGGDAAVSGLVEIFSPSKYLNEQTFEVTRTQEQYDTLMAFDITRETHYVDEIIDFIVCDINFQGEENVTDEDVRGMIQQWVEDGRKVEIGDLEGAGANEGESQGGQGEQGSDSWYTIIPFEGTWYATTTVNIRSTPTTEEDNIVGQLAFAEAVEADGATSDAKFVRIVYEGEYAFVSASLLQDTKPERQTQPSNQGGSSDQGGSTSSENSGTQGGNGTEGLPDWWDETGQGQAPDHEIDWNKVGSQGSFNGN